MMYPEDKFINRLDNKVEKLPYLIDGQEFNIVNGELIPIQENMRPNLDRIQRSSPRELDSVDRAILDEIKRRRYFR